MPPRYPQSLRWAAQTGAARRARTTFWRSLTPTQRREWREDGGVTVIGSEGGRYRIKPDTSMNIYRLAADDYAVERLCVTFDGADDCGEYDPCRCPECTIPVYDLWLAQKLLIEGDEAAFHVIAVRYPS